MLNRLPRIALVGAGSMGANHARTIARSGVASVGVVVDPASERAQQVANSVGATATTELDEALECDAVVVASATPTHHAIGLRVLEAGLPLLMEKPIADTWDRAQDLVTTAHRTGTPLMCGFVERFNPVVRAASQVLESIPVHLLAVRHSPPAPRIGVGVVQDLLLHDLDLAMQFFRTPFTQTSGHLLEVPTTGIEEVADCHVAFTDGGLASLSASRASQMKVRRVTVTTQSELVELDLLRQTLTVYRHVEHAIGPGGGPSYRAQTVIDIPFIARAGEPLSMQFLAFLELVRGAADPIEGRSSILPPHRAAFELQEHAPRSPLTINRP